MTVYIDLARHQKHCLMSGSKEVKSGKYDETAICYLCPMKKCRRYFDGVSVETDEEGLKWIQSRSRHVIDDIKIIGGK